MKGHKSAVQLAGSALENPGSPTILDRCTNERVPMNVHRLRRNTVVPIFDNRIGGEPALNDHSRDNEVELRTTAWMNSREAAAYLRISVGHLRNLVWRRKIAANRGTGRLLFKRVDLDKLIESSNNGRIQWR